MRFHPYALVVGLTLAGVGPAHAQTDTPAPAPASTRPNFSGAWTFDAQISTDPARASFNAQSNENNRRDGQRRGGFSGGGRGGMGGGGFGGRGGYGGSGGQGGGNTDTADPSTLEERTRLSELTDLVKRSSASLVISHNDPTLAITDSQGRTQLFQTSGGKDDHQLATTTVQSTTRWEGARLVTEYALSDRGKLVYTYTLVPTTKQLVVRINLQGLGRGGGSEVKLVYNLTPLAK